MVSALDQVQRCNTHYQLRGMASSLRMCLLTLVHWTLDKVAVV